MYRGYPTDFENSRINQVRLVVIANSDSSYLVELYHKIC
jgi:hypothetical protein